MLGSAASLTTAGQGFDLALGRCTRWEETFETQLLRSTRPNVRASPHRERDDGTPSLPSVPGLMTGIHDL